MYDIKVEANFSAAHNLRGYRGKCEELHGHNWKVEIVVSSEKQDKIGMVLDFRYLKMELLRVLGKLDHKYLNKIPYFSATGGKVNPTSESLARYIYDILKKKIRALKSVTVWESDNSCATYYVP